MDESFKERLDAEFVQLCERIDKLNAFLRSPSDIGSEQLALLTIQLCCMQAYRSVLERRRELLGS